MCALLWKWIYATCLFHSVSFLWCGLFSRPTWFVIVCATIQDCVIVVLILLPDIPLSCLEERKSEQLRLLKEQISQLKRQMSGDCQPAGNVKTLFRAPTCCIFTVHCVVWYRLILASLLQVVMGLLGDHFSKTSTVNLSSWPDLKKLICKMFSTTFNLLYQWAKISLVSF